MSFLNFGDSSQGVSSQPNKNPFSFSTPQKNTNTAQIGQPSGPDPNGSLLFSPIQPQTITTPNQSTSAWNQTSKPNTMNQGLNIWGQTSQTNAMNQSMQFGNTFTQTQDVTLQQQGQQPRPEGWLAELQDIVDAYNAQNVNCRFVSVVYDLIRPGQPPMAWPGMLADLYEDARKQNPDPEKYSPVPLIGIEDVLDRISLQQRADDILSNEMEEMEREIRSSQDHLFNIRKTKIPQLQLEMNDLSHRLLKVCKVLDCLRGSNKSFSSNEQELLSQLTDVGRVLDQLPTKMEHLRDSIEQPMGMDMDNHNAMKDALNTERKEKIDKLFAKQRKTIEELKSLLQTDLKDCAMMVAGLEDIH